jgi:hypothetical protein
MALGRALRCVGALVLAVASLAVAAEPRLMYRGEPGDCLVYERRGAISSLSGAARESELVDQIRVWYLAAEGGELLVLLDRVAIVDGVRQHFAGGWHTWTRMGVCACLSPHSVGQLSLTRSWSFSWCSAGRCKRN